MKTTLKYEFEDNEDDSRFYMIVNAENSFWSLYDLDQELRDISREPQKAINMDIEPDSAENIRRLLREIMHDKGLDLDQVS